MAQGGAAVAAVEAVIQHVLFGIGIRTSSSGQADLGGPCTSAVGRGESRGSAFGFGRASQPLWERRSSGSFARVGGAPGPGTRHDARVMPGVNKECYCMLHLCIYVCTYVSVCMYVCMYIY